MKASKTVLQIHRFLKSKKVRKTKKKEEKEKERKRWSGKRGIKAGEGKIRCGCYSPVHYFYTQ